MRRRRADRRGPVTGPWRVPPQRSAPRARLAPRSGDRGRVRGRWPCCAHRAGRHRLRGRHRDRDPHGRSSAPSSPPTTRTCRTSRWPGSAGPAATCSGTTSGARRAVPADRGRADIDARAAGGRHRQHDRWRAARGRRRLARGAHRRLHLSGLDILFAFPGILLAVLAAAVFGAGLTAAAIALAIAYMPYVARVLRGAALKERNQPYVAALEVQGASAASICLRHLIPNIMPLIVAQARSCSVTRWSTWRPSPSSASGSSRPSPTGES